jgi:hypothetical protein
VRDLLFFAKDLFVAAKNWRVQKITVAFGLLIKTRVSFAWGAIVKEIGVVLESCRALIKQINAGLSTEKPFVNASSAAELLFYLESAASVLKKSALSPRE